MDTQGLDKLVDETIGSIKNLLIVKGGEYAGTSDRLSNFKRGAAMTGCKPLTVLTIYLSKHFDAFSTYVRDMQTGVDRPRSEPIEGRLDDLINYCILAKAIIQEDRLENNWMNLRFVEGEAVCHLRGEVAKEFNDYMAMWRGSSVLKGPLTYLGNEVVAYELPTTGWVDLEAV